MGEIDGKSWMNYAQLLPRLSRCVFNPVLVPVPELDPNGGKCAVDINGGIWREATVHSNFHDAVSQDESRRRKEKTECKAEAGTTETVHKSTWNDLPAQLPCRVLLCLCYSRRVCPSSPRGSPPSTITLEERYVWITRDDQECRDSAGV